MKRLVCLLRGHIPSYRLESAYSTITDTYLTPCDRCHRVIEAKVERG